MILLIRNASVWMRLASRWATVGSFSAARVSASSPMAPIGVLSSWLTLATKSRRISSRRRRSDTSSIAAITPKVRRPSSISWVDTAKVRRGRAVEVEGLVRRALLPGIGEQVDDGLGGQGVTVSTSHQSHGARVSEHDGPVLVAHDDTLGERVEGTAQPDGVRRGLGHRLGGAIGDELEVVQRGLDPHAVVFGRSVDTEPRRQCRQALFE